MVVSRCVLLLILIECYPVDNMVHKRPFEAEDIYDVSLKHPKQAEPSKQLVSFSESVFSEDASNQRPKTSGEGVIWKLIINPTMNIVLLVEFMWFITVCSLKPISKTLFHCLDCLIDYIAFYLVYFF